jgi:hypothetical protein
MSRSAAISLPSTCPAAPRSCDATGLAARLGHGPHATHRNDERALGRLLRVDGDGRPGHRRNHRGGHFVGTPLEQLSAFARGNRDAGRATGRRRGGCRRAISVHVRAHGSLPYSLPSSLFRGSHPPVSWWQQSFSWPPRGQLCRRPCASAACLFAIVPPFDKRPQSSQT